MLRISAEVFLSVNCNFDYGREGIEVMLEVRDFLKAGNWYWISLFERFVFIVVLLLRVCILLRNFEYSLGVRVYDNGDLNNKLIYRIF